MRKLLSMLLMLLGTFQGFSQIDSIFGKYIMVVFGNSSIITLHPNNTFSYRSPIDIGDVPITTGSLEFIDDTVIFKYHEQIHPEIQEIETYFNPERKNILLNVSGNIREYQSVMLYVNNSFTGNNRSLSFMANTLEVDSIQATDSLFIHFGSYSRIPITLDLENANEYHYFINLPAIPTMYYLTQDKALVKKGLLYFSISTGGIYYNTNVFKKKKDIRKIRNTIWGKFIEEMEKL